MSFENINISESKDYISIFEAILGHIKSSVIVKNSGNEIVYYNNSAASAFKLNSHQEFPTPANFSIPPGEFDKLEKEITVNNEIYYLQILDRKTAHLNSEENFSFNPPSANSIMQNENDETNNYFKLFQASPVGLLFFDNHSIVIDCNPAFQNIFKLTKEQCIGINLFEKLKDPKLREALNNMYQHGFGLYEDLYSSIIDGKEIPVKIILKKVIGNNEPIGGLAMVIDMAEKFNQQKILQRSENKYKTIFDSINDAILINNIITGAVIDCNQKACDMFQYSKEELINKTIDQLSENISPFTTTEGTEIIKKAISSGPQVFNWRARKKDFSLFWVEVNMRVTVIDNIKLVIVVLRDITEQLNQSELKNNLYTELENKAEELTELNTELKNTESKLRTISENKDKFYSTISHDLKSPFLSILGYTEFLDNNIERLTSLEIKDSLNSLNLAISNVYSLIERLLEWSRTQSGDFYFQPEHLKLAKIFDNNIDVLIKNANYKNIRVINDIDSEVTVIADEYMLSSIIRNLVGNAIKFSYVNSEIIISSRRDETYELVMIKDFGTGIAPDIIEKLFSPKFNVSKEGPYRETGIGLGMLLCKEWIEKNDGKLWLESEINKGTTVYFTLPFQK